MKTRLFSTTMMLFVGLTSIAQISFSDQTLDLTDPTHFSGNAVCIQDANGDGLDDLIILDDARQLKIEFQGLDGVWTSYTGGQMGNGNAWGMAAADMDGNGFSDVFSGLSNGNPDYARANEDGTEWTMEDLTGYPLFFQGSSLADFDADGDLDYYVCADTDESAIWENDGSGNMTYSGSSIIDLTVEGWDGSGNYGSTATDFDLDGDLDLYVAHCRQGVQSSTDPRRINQLFVNDGENNYTEAAADYGLDIGAQSWTADFADVDNDGDFDVFLTNHDVDNMLLINTDGEYEDIFPVSGLNMSVGVPIQAVFKDLDNDMYMDLIVTGSDHAVFHNNGDNTFSQVEGIFDGPDMESFAVGDVNHDGFLDVYGSYAEIYNDPSDTPDRLWVNDGNDNHFITVALEGTISNNSAVGTVVKAYGPWGMQVREVRAGESYGMVNSLHTHFGLGDNTMIDSLVIDWPSSGIHQVIAEPGIDQFITVVENECVAQAPQINVDGDPIICEGEMLTLSIDLSEGQSVLWSTGESTTSIDVSSAGVFMAEVSGDGCVAITTSVAVSFSPDETPAVMADGPLEFCEGQTVTLTSSMAGDYEWSTGEFGQSIEVGIAGDYSVTITGACEEFTSETLSVVVLDSPEVSVSDQTVTQGESVTLVAEGESDEVRWYDAPVDGALLETGSTYTTPILDSPTSYWYEADNLYGGEQVNGGKSNAGDGQYHDSADFYLIFDTYEDMTIHTVKVYAEDSGSRTIQLRSSDGDLIESSTQMIESGSSIVILDFYVPQGEQYSLRGSGDPGLWRDNDPDGVNFPYLLDDLGSITGTNVQQQNADNYYYFFYDWEVVSTVVACTTEREEVFIDVVTGLIEGEAFRSVSTYPNPTTGELNLDFGEGMHDVEMTMTDMTGRTVLMENWAVIQAGITMKVLLSDLTDGVYLLRVQSENGYRTEQIVLQR